VLLLIIVIFMEISMSDYEILKKNFEDMGIKFNEVDVEASFGKCPAKVEYDGKIEFDQLLRLGNGVGYYSFECDHYFLEGKYQGHGVWE